MIEFENVEVFGWEASIRGLRSPLNSWDKSDSGYVTEYDEGGFDAEFYKIGDNDLDLMKKLIAAGSDHSKFMRMINVTLDITAPLYWWKEFDTYKVGTVRNSCSTMHKIHEKEFTLDDFSFEDFEVEDGAIFLSDCFKNVVADCEMLRRLFVETGDKKYWRGLIQLLPESYNQRATVQLNYAVLRNMYHGRKYHKLDEWHDFCHWIESLPYSELITGGERK